jgi:hypothetical protein
MFHYFNQESPHSLAFQKFIKLVHNIAIVSQLKFSKINHLNLSSIIFTGVVLKEFLGFFHLFIIKIIKIYNTVFNIN